MGKGSFFRYLKYYSAFSLEAEEIAPIPFEKSQY